MIRATLTVLALVLLAPGNAAFAQGAGAKAEPTPGGATQEPPAEETIRAAEVAGRAAATDQEIRKILALLGSDPAVEDIVSQIEATRTELEDLASQDAERIQNAARTETLDDIGGRWQRRAGVLEGWNVTLTERAKQFGERLARIDDLEKLWTRTRKNLRDAKVPGAVIERADAVISRIGVARKEVEAREAVVLGIQASIVLLAEQSAKMLDLVSDAQARIQSNLLTPDALPLWTAITQGQIDRDKLKEEFATLMEAVATTQEFLIQRRERLAMHALAVLLGVGVLSMVRRRALTENDEEDTSNASALVLSRPYSSAFLIGCAVTPFVYPAAPRYFYGAVGIAGLIPIIRLIPPMLEQSARPIFYALVCFFVIDRVRDLIAPMHVLERLIFVIEIPAALILLARLFRRGRLPLIADRTQLLPLIGHGVRLGFFLLFVAFGANLLGRTALSELLGEGVLTSAYLAIAVFAVYRVAVSLTTLLLRSSGARRLNMVLRHRALISKRLFWGYRIAAAAAWLLYSLNKFSLRTPVINSFSSLLSAEFSIGDLSFSMGGFFAFLVVFGVAFGFSRLLRFILDEDVLPRMRLPRGVPYAITATIHYSILFMGVVAALTATGIDLGKFSILAGALGVGVGFGLQNVVNNFVSGLILLFERPIKTGDVVEVGNLLGEVRRIGIRASTVRTLDGAEVIVPNANLISDQVVNWTLSDRQRRIEVAVGVKYGTDPERVLALLLQVARDDERILGHPEPDALFLEFGDSSLDFKLRAWTADYANWVRVRSDLTVAVNRALAEAGIEIPFPQRDLHLRSVSEGVGNALRPEEPSK